MSTHDLGWTVEIRDAAGRVLGSAVHSAGVETQLWEIGTVDGRQAAVGTRAQALLELARMCDEVPPEGGEPDGT